MEEFKITMSNTPGALAHVTKQIAKAGANIEAISAIVPHMWDVNPTDPDPRGSTERRVGDGTACIITDDAEKTRYALRQCGVHYTARQVHKEMLGNSVGSLSVFLGGMKKRKINITSLQVLSLDSEGDRGICIGYTTE